jgi:acetyltransferase-like isoleucine patch superfamily enzyme
MLIKAIFGILALLPKVICRVRGIIFRALVMAAGGKCGPGMRIETGFRLRQGFHSRLEFGRDIYIGCNTTMDCLRGARLCIGDNVTLTQGIFISVAKHVSIGKDCLMGEYCSVRDANHAIDALDIPITAQPMLPNPVHIADNVWIGRGCAILAGAEIGTGAVIGANSVVIKPVIAHDIVAGVPAKTIRSRLGR